MKVEIGEVISSQRRSEFGLVSGVDFAVEFKVPADVRIPLGAKVTVEWDENEHRCETSKERHQTMRRFAGEWWLCEWTPDLAREEAKGVISYCTGCGMRLGD